MLMTSCSRIAVHMVFIRLLGWADKPCQDEGISLQTWGACHVFSHTLVFNLGSRNRGEVPGPLGSWQQKKGKKYLHVPIILYHPALLRAHWYDKARGEKIVLIFYPGTAGCSTHHGRSCPTLCASWTSNCRTLRTRCTAAWPPAKTCPASPSSCCASSSRCPGSVAIPPPSPVWLPLFRWRH